MYQSVVIKIIIITLYLSNARCQSNTRPFLNTFISISKAPYITYIKTTRTNGNENGTIIECTGSIIEKNYVLTLASCIDDIDDKSSTTDVSKLYFKTKYNPLSINIPFNCFLEPCQFAKQFGTVE